MNDFPGMDTGSPYSAADAQGASGPQAKWYEALVGLVGSRISLIRLESTSAARLTASYLALILVGALATCFTWALLLVAGIAILATLTCVSWPWIALAAAVCHALVAVICWQLARRSTAPVFPLTRAEFQKDCEWLNPLKTPRKSND
jgi:uncharacterized membrane protein YqjE